jgi:hypothetical protein
VLCEFLNVDDTFNASQVCFWCTCLCFHTLQRLNFFSLFLQIGSGDIICYQKSPKSWNQHTHPSVLSFFKHVHDLKVLVFVLNFSSGSLL